MKLPCITKEEIAQALVAILIVMAIVFSVGAGVLFHSRSFREVTSLQVDSNQAYNLAKSGIELIGEAGTCVTAMNVTYSVGTGNSIRLDVSRTYSNDFSTLSGNSTSVGIAGKSTRFFQGSGSFSNNGWAKTYGTPGSGKNDYLYSLLQAQQDAGYVLGGDSNSYAGRNLEALLIKTNYYGSIDWANIYGDASSPDTLNDLIQIQDDSYVFCGTCNIPTWNKGDELLLVKTASDGTMDWAKAYGFWTGSFNDTCNSVKSTSDSGYVLGGTALAAYGLLVKTDSTGTMTWASLYGSGNYTQIIKSVQQTDDDGDGDNDDGYIIAGYTNCYVGNDFLVIKTDNDFIVNSPSEWHYIYGYKGDDRLSCILQTQDGGYILGGTSNSMHPDYEFYVIKISSAGIKEWAYLYGIDGSDEELNTIEETQDGGFLLGGKTANGAAIDFLFIKISSVGAVEFARQYGKSGDGNRDNLQSLSSTNDGGYVVAGQSSSFDASYDFFIVKNDTVSDALDCCSFDVGATVYATDLWQTFREDPQGDVSGSPGVPVDDSTSKWYYGIPQYTFIAESDPILNANFERNNASLPSPIVVCPES